MCMINICTHSHMHSPGWQGFHQEHSGKMEHRKAQSSWTQTRALDPSILLGEEGRQCLSSVLDSLVSCACFVGLGAVIPPPCPQDGCPPWHFAQLKLQACLGLSFWPQSQAVSTAGDGSRDWGPIRLCLPGKRITRCFYLPGCPVLSSWPGTPGQALLYAQTTVKSICLKQIGKEDPSSLTLGLLEAAASITLPSLSSTSKPTLSLPQLWAAFLRMGSSWAIPGADAHC